MAQITKGRWNAVQYHSVQKFGILRGVHTNISQISTHNFYTTQNVKIKAGKIRHLT